MSKKVEMIGKTFGRLTVIEESPIRKNKAVCWICKCACGKVTHPIKGTGLRNGTTKSCGCLIPESIAKAHTTHGLSGTRIHRIWDNMIRRCGNPNKPEYKNYGGRGITVCEDWKKSFKAFYDYVSQLPHYEEEGYTLDRIDNNGNYEPGNVRWASWFEQASTRRNTINK